MPMHRRTTLLFSLLCLVIAPRPVSARGVFTIEPHDGHDIMAKLDGEHLVTSFDANALRSGPNRLALPLPDASAPGGIRFETFTSSRFEARPDGDVTWRGELRLDPTKSLEFGPGQLVLRLHEGRLAGAAFTADGNFDIVPRGAGRALVRRADEDSLPCVTRERAPTAARKAEVPAAAAEGTARVTLLALYTDSARDGAGGVPEIEAAVLAAVDLTNTVFANGPIDATIDVVHIEYFDVTRLGELPDLQTALDRLKVEPGAKALRDEVGADLVTLIAGGGAGLCGIAEAMDDVGPQFAPEAYSVAVRSCLLSQLALTHEIGHNLGARHNPEDSEATPATASYPWSFGHVGAAFRTVMAYDRTCTAACPIQPYFSDPDRRITRGASVDEPAGIEGERDNVRTLQLTTTVAAAFRDDVEVPPTCVESTTRRCLQRGRFAVDVTWEDFQGNAGPGRQLTLPSDESVLFWFFGPDNWELLVKVLDGCPINGRVWVFSAGATNVEYQLSVTDTVSGEQRVYDNPLGRTAVTLTDTEAFDACGD